MYIAMGPSFGFAKVRLVHRDFLSVPDLDFMTLLTYIDAELWVKR